jgi:hypothetical protein
MRKKYFKVLLAVLIIICISSLHISCSKNSVQNNVSVDSVILMSNIWYPDMVIIYETDSGNVFSPNKDTIVYKDTSFYLSQCTQQSTYTFKHNHILEIVNECNPSSQQPSTTVWNLTSTRGMELPIIFDTGLGFVLGIGQLSAIDQSRFVFNSPHNISEYFGTSVGYIQTIKNIFITFKKK